ncbi:uncharacterized protein LOC125955447 [Anopheles darlingi]|uniref:uncharacterized protein LOC125955447 n=1 Tax=Anopheles darlingi TaxID=43151 RepID=UPI00210009BA|nr:uncharacterized protein LOC125955447 [Anopheles darlingi]
MASSSTTSHLTSAAASTGPLGLFGTDAGSAFNSLAIGGSGSSCLAGGSSAYDKKTMSSCRYQQDKANSVLPEYFSDGSVAAVAAAAAASRALGGAGGGVGGHHGTSVMPSVYSPFSESALVAAAAAAAASSSQQTVAAAQGQATTNPLFSPHFGSGPTPYAAMQVGGYETTSSSSSAARSCALPSPTIYPPTPPPSAPWIHPWYGGDTF